MLVPKINLRWRSSNDKTEAWNGVRLCLSANVDCESGWWRSVTMLLTQLWMMIAWVFFRCDRIAEASNVLALSTLTRGKIAH